MVLPGWIPACTAFAAAHGLSRFMKVLAAFGTAEEPVSTPAPDFEQVERDGADLLPDLARRVETRAAMEVDAAQAAMFGRRCQVVATLLDALAPRSTAGRLLRTGFACRLDELLSADATAIRLRAIIDFYYSHAAVLHHLPASETDRGPAPWELAAPVRWIRVTRGLFAGSVSGMSRRGPTRISLLRFDRLRFRFRCVDARAASGEGALLEELAAAQGAVAAFSGGFFLYSEPDIVPPARRHDPVGLLVTDGRVVAPPIYRRPAFAQDGEGRVHFLQLGMKDVLIELGNDLALHPGGVNSRAVATRSPVVFHRGIGVVVSELPGRVLRFSAGRFIDCTESGADIPAGGFVVSLPAGRDWESLAESMIPGTQVGFRLAKRPGPMPVQAMAGGPTLLSGGQVVLPLVEEDFDGLAEPRTLTLDETGDQNLLPRMAVGLTAEHEVIVAAADGRNFDRALGLTLSDLSSVMRAVGCVAAINLDGGSSKRMVADGRVLDLPSTDILGPGDNAAEVRPVYSAVLALPR
jgi:hypothetical protein